MQRIGRRQFCVALGAGIVGLAAGCSNTEGDSALAPVATSSTGAVLAGLSLEVRVDPG